MTLPSAQLCAVPSGRAYKIEQAPGFYISEIHTQTIGEAQAGSQFEKWILGPVWNKPPHQIYMGIGGFINLSLIAGQKFKQGILFDINPVQTLYWQRLVKMIAAIPDAGTFRDFLLQSDAVMLANCRQLYDDQWDVLERTLAGIEIFARRSALRSPVESPDFNDPNYIEYEWLRNGYAHLHAMARRGDLTALTLDLTDTDSWAQLDRFLQDRGLCVGGLYLSNAISFLDLPHDWAGRPRNSTALQATFDNLRRVITPETHVIDASMTPIVRRRNAKALGISYDENAYSGKPRYTALTA